LEVDGRPAAYVVAPRGCPANPLDPAALRAKVRALAGNALDGALDDPARPAAGLLAPPLGGPQNDDGRASRRPARR
jgi:hypothetical protein